MLRQQPTPKHQKMLETTPLHTSVLPVRIRNTGSRWRTITWALATKVINSGLVWFFSLNKLLPIFLLFLLHFTDKLIKLPWLLAQPEILLQIAKESFYESNLVLVELRPAHV